MDVPYIYLSTSYRADQNLVSNIATRLTREGYKVRAFNSARPYDPSIIRNSRMVVTVVPGSTVVIGKGVWEEITATIDYDIPNMIIRPTSNNLFRTSYQFNRQVKDRGPYDFTNYGNLNLRECTVFDNVIDLVDAIITKWKSLSASDVLSNTLSNRERTYLNSIAGENTIEAIRNPVTIDESFKISDKRLLLLRK